MARWLTLLRTLPGLAVDPPLRGVSGAALRTGDGGATGPTGRRRTASGRVVDGGGGWIVEREETEAWASAPARSEESVETVLVEGERVSC